MLFLQVSLCLIFSSLVDVVLPFQINLDLTEWGNGSAPDRVLRHDCLHIAAWPKDEDNLHKIISYCLSEWPWKWHIQKNSLDQEFTFNELSELNITSYQLYLWSAPIDVVENYQLYLDELSMLNKKSMARYRYSNCTLPKFGPLCQYSFDDHEYYHPSLTDIILVSLQKNILKARNQTCYTHLQCDTGLSSVCIGWLNICDRIIQCIDGIDEEHCWQLDINKCKEDEYRCRNGQCIPMTFLHDNDNAPDCLDSSDEDVLELYQAEQIKRWFKYEDLSCLKFTIYSRTTQMRLMHDCIDTYAFVFPELIFSVISDTISNTCWLALNCYFVFSNSLISNCDNICYQETCKQLIDENCPDMFYMPNVPVAFGHIYMAYTKQYIVGQRRYTDKPEYICYNPQLCSGFYPNRTTLSFNGTTCRRPQDFPLYYTFTIPTDTWFNKYVIPIYEKLFQCNTLLRNSSEFCDPSTMYQCINSSKHIAKNRLLDDKVDCDYGDDERQILINGDCPKGLTETHFRCLHSKGCYSRKLIEDDRCHCKLDDSRFCEDEDMNMKYSREHISFPIICNHFIHLLPILINGTSETDETDCEQWPCNNTYTRCDGIWDCLDGADEVGCHPSSLLNCPLHHHVCISNETKKYMCLTINKTNDGKIDCLGATDERRLCHSMDYTTYHPTFYCETVDRSNCLARKYLCDGQSHCTYGDDEQFCGNILHSHLLPHTCDLYLSKLPDVDQFLCNLFPEKMEVERSYFSLGKVRKSGDDIANQNTKNILTRSSTDEITTGSPYHCHRGINLRVWLDTGKNLSTITCLCTQNYYGDRCQYQNQRVSLSIKFRAFSDSWQTPFIVVVMLIDDSDERTIHSHEQFSYLSAQNCKKKFNIILLYSTRPKNPSQQYSIHIDVYEKLSLLYRGSVLLPLRFPFLPTERIAVELDIPYTDDSYKSCSDHRCVHGQCIQYFDQPKNTTFCQCNHGWSGRYCTISHTCTCSSDSLCVGLLANNRSLCICPIKKWGPRCLLHEQICQFSTTCHNGSRCMPIDRPDILNKNFTCICPQGFFGERCEIPSNELILSFHKDIILPQRMFVHFVEVKDDDSPENGTTFKTLPVNRNAVTIYWASPFHIAFVEFYPNKYYLIIVQQIYNQSIKIEKTIIPSDHCPHISEVFNETLLQWPLIRRIKYYHLPCQRHSSQLSCFYDHSQFCLCYDFGGQRLANCFDFNHTLKHNCRGRSKCENGAQCLQDRVSCPETSMCVCPPCFYGAYCQLSASGLGLSLDAILGGHIQPHIGITDQPLIVQISLTLTVLITLLGLLNGILSMMTFMNKEPRKTGCGFYLAGSSITTLLIMIVFSLKFSFLLAAQMTYMTNRSFLRFQCGSLDFILRSGLNMDQWLNACVAVERAFTTIQGLTFDKRKSIKLAKFIIPVLFCLTTGANIHEIIHRDLLNDDSNDEKRIWCIVTYSASIQTYNLVVNIFHFCIPFIINLLSATIIIIRTTRFRATAQTQQNYRTVLFEQLQQHRQLLITPFLLIILAIPRLIISFVSGCMKSTADSWLYLIGYFISFIPPMLTFIIFVIPSKMYKDEFYNTVRRYQRTIRARFQFFL